MKAARRIEPQITEEEPTVNEYIGLNTFGPHADLAQGELRECLNLDIYGPSSTFEKGLEARGYLKTRDGSRVTNSSTTPNFNIINKAIFDAGDEEFIVVQMRSGLNAIFKFVKISSVGNWTDVVEKSDGVTPYTITGQNLDSVDFTVSNGKIYIFSEFGNSIIEFDPSTSLFLRRKMGLPALQITDIVSADETTPDTGLNGKRVYGVELVYKDESVSPAVDIIVSGPNRAVLTVNPTFKEGRLAYAEGTAQEYTVEVSPTLNDGTLITATENSNWTHARLYRTKDVTTATNSVPDLEGPAEILGRDDELYQVQEIDKSTFLATLSGGVYSFDADFIADDAVPFPLDIVVGDRLDMNVIPAGTTGTFHRNRIWVSGVKEVPGPAGFYQLSAIESKIFYTPESDTQYSESMRALDAIEAEPGDGDRMIKIISFQADLLGIKEGKTGRVQYGDPNSGWITEDHVIGIDSLKFAEFVPNVGICAIVNDQRDFRIFGYDLAWHSTFAGVQISRPIRNIIKALNFQDVGFFYAKGKLFFNLGSGEMLVLAVEQKKGWARYRYPFNFRTETVYSYDEGRRVGVINRDQPTLEIEVDGLDTDYDVVSGSAIPIEYGITTHRFQYLSGRALIEQRYLSIVAILQTKMAAQPYVNGKLWDVPFNLLLDPEDYPEEALREIEYQGYSEYKPVGNYLHYDLGGFGPATIYSIMLNCLVQRGQVMAGFDPFELLAGATRKPPWASVLLLKDAGEQGRMISEFTQNDAGDTTRDINDFQQDDAGNEGRES